MKAWCWDLVLGLDHLGGLCHITCHTLCHRNKMVDEIVELHRQLLAAVEITWEVLKQRLV
jgi:hypothetical protein